MSKCNTCQYRASSDKPWKCEYISIIGHSRGCEPGDNCTKYKFGDRLPLPIVRPLFDGNYAEQTTK